MAKVKPTKAEKKLVVETIKNKIEKALAKGPSIGSGNADYVHMGFDQASAIVFNILNSKDAGEPDAEKDSE